MGYVAASQQAVNLAAADVARLYDAEVDNTFGVPVVSVLGRRGPLGGNARGVHSDGHAAGGHLPPQRRPRFFFNISTRFPVSPPLLLAEDAPEATPCPPS